MNNTENTENMYKRFIVDICEDPYHGNYVVDVYEAPYIVRPTRKKPFVGRIYINEPADAWEGTRKLFNT